MKNGLGKTLFVFAAFTLPLSAQTPATLPGPLIANVSNAPNPFDSRLGGLDGQTRISYTLTEASDVDVAVYDLFGHRVRQWRFSANDTGAQAGDNAFFWDGTNEAGQKVSKGGYLARIQVRSAASTATTLRKIGVIH